MARISITAELEIDNAAFDGIDPITTAGEVLQQMLFAINASNKTSSSIVDANGNTVGSWNIELPECQE